jgi:hypothetical protein
MYFDSGKPSEGAVSVGFHEIPMQQGAIVANLSPVRSPVRDPFSEALPSRKEAHNSSCRLLVFNSIDSILVALHICSVPFSTHSLS